MLTVALLLWPRHGCEETSEQSEALMDAVAIPRVILAVFLVLLTLISGGGYFRCLLMFESRVKSVQH